MFMMDDLSDGVANDTCFFGDIWMVVMSVFMYSVLLCHEVVRPPKWQPAAPVLPGPNPRAVTTTIGAYKGFTFYFRIPLLVKDDANHDKEMVESSIIEIDRTEHEDSCPKQLSLLLGMRPTPEVPLGL